MKKKSAGLRSLRSFAVPSADVARVAQEAAIAAAKASHLHYDVARVAQEAAIVAAKASHLHYMVIGAGSVLDLAGSNLHTPEFESLWDDAAKVRNDFYRIGNDLRDVLGQVHHLG